MPPAGLRPARTGTSLARAESRAREARERGLQEGNAGRPAVGARYIRAGLRQLGWAEADSRPDAQRIHASHQALAARLLMILAVWESEQGRTEQGLRLLDRAGSLVAADDRGILLVQRGYLLMRAWRGNEAVRTLDEAIALLDGNPAETENLAAALLNRSFAHLNAARVGQARADLTWCRRVATDEGYPMIAAKTLHNLGYCELLTGDIPAALRLFEAAAIAYQVTAPGNLPVLATDKARALLAVGLARDAVDELDAAMTSFRRQRLDYDLADAELARSEAARATGELAAAMRGRGLARDADVAELTAARALAAAGRLAEARQRISGVRRRGTTVSLDVSLLRRLARAELAEREGRSGAALAELRAGLARVQAQRDRLGSIDLRTGTAALGVDLAAAGLRLALQRGSPPMVFAWLELSRAQAFRARPVRPPADPEAAAILAELRQLSLLLREAELAGSRDPGMVSRQAELQREIREHEWKADGRGEATPRASLSQVSVALAVSGQTLVGIVGRPGEMAAVVAGREPARLIRLGDFETAAEAAKRLNADLDTLAGRLLPARLEAVIRESIRHQAATLTAEIIAPLRGALGDGGIVFVPAGPLAGIRRCCWPGRTWSTRPGRSPRSPGSIGAAARCSSSKLRWAPRCGPSTAPGSPTWPRTGTTTRRTSCSPGSTWLTVR